MKTLKIELSQADAVAFYTNSNASGKELLEKKFGKEIFNLNITDKVKTFEDACAVLNLNPYDVLTHKGTFFTVKQRRANAFDKLEVIIQAVNEGWQPYWNDSNQAKFFPWFEYKSKGFSLCVVYCAYLGASVPSCLCFKSRELATYVATQFNTIYNEYLQN